MMLLWRMTPKAPFAVTLPLPVSNVVLTQPTAGSQPSRSVAPWPTQTLPFTSQFASPSGAPAEKEGNSLPTQHRYSSLPRGLGVLGRISAHPESARLPRGGDGRRTGLTRRQSGLFLG